MWEVVQNCMNKYLAIVIKKQILLGVLIAGLLTAGALLIGEKYWESHPYFAGLLTGTTTLFITFLIIETWKIEYSNSLWREVAKVAYKDMSRLCKDLVGFVQLTYVSPELILARSHQSVNSASSAQHLDPWDLDLKTRAMRSGRLDILQSIFVTESVSSNDHRHVPVAELAENLSTPEMVSWAISQIDNLWTTHCSLISQWASLMMNSSESREFLNSFATLDHDFRILYYQLNAVLSALPPKGIPNQEKMIAEIWFSLNYLDLRARVLHNKLRRRAEPDYIGRPDEIILCPKSDSHYEAIIEREFDFSNIHVICDSLKFQN